MTGVAEAVEMPMLLSLKVMFDECDDELLLASEDAAPKLVALESNADSVGTKSTAIPLGLKWMVGLLASSCFRRSSSSAREGSLKAVFGPLLISGAVGSLLVLLRFMVIVCEEKRKMGRVAHFFFFEGLPFSH